MWLAGDTHTESLQAALRRREAQVAVRVGPDGPYREEINQVKKVADLVPQLQEQLGLGKFIADLNSGSGKPQALYVFERGSYPEAAGDLVVLKVYGDYRPNEGAVEFALSQANMPVAPVLEHHAVPGEDGYAWFAMDPIPGWDLAEEFARNDKSSVERRTAELATIFGAIREQPGATLVDAVSLVPGIYRHLETVSAPLIKHGYELPEGWQDYAKAVYSSGTQVPLHNDAGPNNIRVIDTSTPEGQRYRARTGTDLVVLDYASDSVLGAPEFDVARWIVRASAPITPGNTEFDRRLYDRLVSTALRAQDVQGRPALDERVLRGMLWTELVMQAGVNEIVKDEQGLPWSWGGDRATAELLEVAELERRVNLSLGGPDPYREPGAARSFGHDSLGGPTS